VTKFRCHYWVITNTDC